MGLKLKTAPSGEPVTLAEAKSHCRIDEADDDSLVTALITAARRQAEHILWRALLTQNWELTLDTFQVDEIVLPHPPLQSVTSITYLDSTGVRQTLDAGEYQVVTDEIVGYVLPAYGKSWPACRQQPGSVVVTYVCGYGKAVDVPQPIRQWMLLQIGHWYENRESSAERAPAPLPFVDGLLDAYRVPVAI